MERPKPYWFPAKRHGWGWGLPSTWQGWVVFAIFLAAVAAICVAYPPRTGVARFLVLIGIATALFTLVCWMKGAPPRWSWGEKGDEDG